MEEPKKSQYALLNVVKSHKVLSTIKRYSYESLLLQWIIDFL